MDKLNEARQFLRQRSIEPVLAHPAIAQKHRNKFGHVNRLLNRFPRIGDLVTYMARYEQVGAPLSPWEKAVNDAGLQTLDDIYTEFRDRFGRYENVRTRLDDFTVGEVYSSWTIVIFAQTYDPRSGGILPIGDKANPDAIFIRATLDGTGPYPNQWLKPGEELKYYMKAIKDVFKTSYADNRAIIESAGKPIYVFEKCDQGRKLVGLFRYQEHVIEPDGKMWFRLVKRDAFEHGNPTRTEEVREDLEREIEKAIKDTPAARQARLETAPKKPKARQTVTITYDRNADVIVEILRRANGICERCHQPAPFIRKKDETPYLEVHHRITLANGGEDTVENAIALCPNCHREMHYGVNLTI